ncbi:MAG: hypothetical protein ACI9DJ_003305, partial [Algoriphagus sp.]
MKPFRLLIFFASQTIRIQALRAYDELILYHSSPKGFNMSKKLFKPNNYPERVESKSEKILLIKFHIMFFQKGQQFFLEI